MCVYICYICIYINTCACISKQTARPSHLTQRRRARAPRRRAALRGLTTWPSSAGQLGLRTKLFHQECKTSARNIEHLVIGGNKLQMFAVQNVFAIQLQGTRSPCHYRLSKGRRRARSPASKEFGHILLSPGLHHVATARSNRPDPDIPNVESCLERDHATTVPLPREVCASAKERALHCHRGSELSSTSPNRPPRGEEVQHNILACAWTVCGS